MRAIMTIKIGALTYRVVRVKRIAGGARGECDFAAKTIRVLEGLERDVENETILHEVSHAIDPSMGEQKIHTFSNRFYQVLVDNPMFTRRYYKPLK